MGRSIYQKPLPKATTDEMFDAWQGVMARHECASVLSLAPWDRYYRIAQFIEERGRQIQKRAQLTPLTLKNLNTENEAEFIEKLNQLKKDGKTPTVFIILDGEWLLTGVPHLLPTIQNYVLMPYRLTSFLIFFEKNLLLPQFSQSLSANHPLRQNIIYQNLYLGPDMVHFLKHMEQLYGFSLKERERQEIIANCGGHIWLATEALRFAHMHKTLSFDHEAMQIKLQTIWNNFEAEEKSVIRKIVLKQSLGEKDFIPLNYFVKTGLLQKSAANYQLTVPVLGKFIKETVSRDLKIKISADGKLRVGEVNVSAFFSARELNLIKYFTEHEGQIVDRDTVGNILWGDAEDAYSDWALNQAIKRLRDRFSQLGLSQNLIKTVKSKGFIYTGVT